MTNEDYWAKRYEALAARGQLNDEAFIKQLLTHYKGTQVKLEALLGYFYSRYAKNGKISYADAVKLLNKAELADFKMSLEEFRREAIAGGYDQVLEEIYLSSSVSRLQALQAQMDANILALANQSMGMVGGHLVNTYTDTYYRSVHQIQTGTGLATDFARYNEPLVREIINQPWQNGDFSTRIWENQFRLINQLEKVLAQGAITGESIDQMAKALAEKMAVSERNARRLVNTESAHAVSRATTQSYEDTGVVEYKFSATLDIITSEICRELDGKKFAVKDKTEGLNAPPMHINCRSHTVPYFADDSGLRVARDKNGKTVWVDKNLNYKEWHKQYVESDPEYRAVEKAHRNKGADKKQYDKYKEIYGKDMPNKFEDFQKMKYNDPKKWEQMKAGKQERLNAMDPKDMGNLKGKLGDGETRGWYKAHNEAIPNKIDRTKPIEAQAREAHRMRNDYRTQARDLMRDQEKRKGLDQHSPNKTFDQLVADKMTKKKMTKEEAVQDVLGTATKTNKAVNKKLGLEE